jgi:hypothetical protein
MKEGQDQPGNDEPARRTFIKGGASALLAASCLTALGSRAGTAQASTALNSAATTYICPPCGHPVTS